MRKNRSSPPALPSPLRTASTIASTTGSPLPMPPFFSCFSVTLAFSLTLAFSVTLTFLSASSWSTLGPLCRSITSALAGACLAAFLASSDSCSTSVTLFGVFHPFRPSHLWPLALVRVALARVARLVQVARLVWVARLLRAARLARVARLVWVARLVRVARLVYRFAITTVKD